NKCRRELRPTSIGQIKRSPLSIENTRCSFDNQAVQIGRPDRFAESFTKAVQEIEDQRLLDLDFFLRALQPANAASLSQQGVHPQPKAADQQPNEDSWRERGQLFPRCRLMAVLFYIIENVFKPRKIFWRRFTPALMR